MDMKKAFVSIVTLCSFSIASWATPASKTTLAELKKNAQILDCSKKYTSGGLQTQAGPQPGKVTMRLKLDAGGSVVGGDEETTLSTIHEDSLRQCLISALRVLKFPSESKGQAKEILVPVDFPI
jgi:hypothetical protein